MNKVIQLSSKSGAVQWRVNAVVILLTAVLACAVLAFAAREIFKEATRTRQATGVVNVAEEQIDRSKVQLGRFDAVRGSTLLRAPLRVEQTYGFSSGSKETASVQNYLFYEPSDGSSHWLVPGNKGLFLSERELPEREYTKNEEPVVAVVYELVESDTTGDRKLTANDAKTIGVSDPSGSRFARVLTGVEDVNSTTLTASGRILVLYTATSTLKAAEIDIGTQKVIRDGPVQTIGKGERAAAQQCVAAELGRQRCRLAPGLRVLRTRDVGSVRGLLKRVSLTAASGFAHRHRRLSRRDGLTQRRIRDAPDRLFVGRSEGMRAGQKRQA